MTKIAIMGQFFKTFQVAEQAKAIRKKKLKKDQVIIGTDNGFLVTSMQQLELVKVSIDN